jgi:hypothetical protein
MVEFSREFLGYDGAAETAADDDHVLLRGGLGHGRVLRTSITDERVGSLEMLGGAESG